MKKENLRIVYMGTPEFAVEGLRALVEGEYHVVGVVTMPDKPMGRHQETPQMSAVKQYALQQNIPVFQPDRLKDESFLTSLRELQADLQIVVAFRMLPEVVWNMPPRGTFNLHASLLPQYRGAAPINWAVINGERETGITTFFIQHEIDTGKVIQQVSIPIEETDNAGLVHDKLMHLGAKLIVETVDAILADTVKAIPQEAMTVHEPLKVAPKIFRETCRIDWSQNTEQIYNFVRGLSPYPAAWTEMEIEGERKQVIKLYATKKRYESHTHPVGRLETDGKNYLRVTTVDGFLDILALQLAGKKRMEVKDFLRGFKYTQGMKMV